MNESIEKSTEEFKISVFGIFLDISQQQMELSNGVKKITHAAALFGGFPHPCHINLLDILFLSIPLGMCALSFKLNTPWATGDSLAKKDANENVVLMVIRKTLSWLLFIPYMLQVVLGAILTVIFLPFIGLVHFLYPCCRSDWTGNIYDEALFIKGQKRRQVFFNPSTWIIPLLLCAGISFLIEWMNPTLFPAAATSLLILQTIFMSTAVLMCIGAIIAMAHGLLCSSPEIPGKEKDPADRNGFFNYFSQFEDWCGKYAYLAAPVIFFGTLSVLSVLVLTIGFFTDGFGLFPGSFTFMAPCFEFVTNAFGAELQSLNIFSEGAIQIISEVAGISILLFAAIFIPDNLRRALQTVSDNTPDNPEVKLEITNNTIGISPYTTSLQHALQEKDIVTLISKEELPAESHWWSEMNYDTWRVGKVIKGSNCEFVVRVNALKALPKNPEILSLTPTA